MRSHRLTLLAVAAAGLVGAPAATAAFDAPQRASKGPLPAHSPGVAVNARGDAVAVWVRGTRRAAMIVASLRPAGGDWSEPVAISRRGRPAINPRAVISAEGLAVVVWRQIERVRRVRTEGGRRRQAVYVAHTRERSLTDARWSRITTLSSSRHKVGPPRIAIDDSGVALATWHWGTGTSRRAPGFVGEVQVVGRRDDGSWGPPTRMSRSTLCSEVRLPRVAIGGRGHAVVWWQCDLPGGRSTALAISRGPGDDFGPEAELPFRTDGRLSADLAISRSGRATAVSASADGTLRWWRGDVDDRLTLQSLPSLGPAERSDADAGPPRIAVGASGDALSAWADRSGRARGAPIAADLGVGAQATLGPPSDTTRGIRVAVADMNRRGAVAWMADGRVRAAARAADGSIGSGEAVSGRGAALGPALAIDATGNATLLWTRVVRGRPVVERAESPAS